MLVTIDVYSSHNPRSATVGKGSSLVNQKELEMNALFAMFSEVLES